MMVVHRSGGQDHVVWPGGHHRVFRAAVCLDVSQIYTCGQRTGRGVLRRPAIRSWAPQGPRGLSRTLLAAVRWLSRWLSAGWILPPPRWASARRLAGVSTTEPVGFGAWLARRLSEGCAPRVLGKVTGSPGSTARKSARSPQKQVPGIRVVAWCSAAWVPYVDQPRLLGLIVGAFGGIAFDVRPEFPRSGSTRVDRRRLVEEFH